MHREIAKAKIQEIHDKGDSIATTDRTYKPSYTIEFNRVGEVLLYSCEPTKHVQIYLKYPYIFYESLIPTALFIFYANPLNLEWHWNFFSWVACNTRTFRLPSMVASSAVLG